MGGGYEEFNAALLNRSLRTVKTELEFLADAGHIPPSTLSSILSQLPTETSIRSTTLNNTTSPPIASPVPLAALSTLSMAQPPPPAAQPLPSATPINEKSSYYQPPAANPPPPAYPIAPPLPPPTLASATALYAYKPTDVGDLELLANDPVSVTEYMNAEWWKGRNERTGAEGIFPANYVRVVEQKGMMQPPPPVGQMQAQGSGYGNVPLDVSQVGSGEGKVPNKGAEMGKKFGKKLGNAAIFGAGATMGSNIVNSIF